MSLKDGTAPDKTTITLTGRNGDVHLITAKIVTRADVNLVFKKPAMGNVGYMVLADVSDLAGDYTLRIEVSANGEKRVCSIQLPLSIVSSGAEAE